VNLTPTQEPTVNLTPTPEVTATSSDDLLVAGFTMNRTSGPAPLAVGFTSTSTGPYDELAWTIVVDGVIVGTMTGATPNHTFLLPNTYTINLEVSASTGETAIAEQNLTVAAPPTATTTPEPGDRTNQPFPSPHRLPGIVQAEDYDVSIDSPAYMDTTAANEGGVYRVDAVDIEVGGSNYDIGWIRPGEFLNYSVDAGSAGSYTLSLRVANPESTVKSVGVSLDGAPAGHVLIAPTGSWLTYREFAASAPLALSPGRHVVTISFDGVNRLNFDWLRFAS
jgi:PKD repeat protein